MAAELANQISHSVVVTDNNTYNNSKIKIDDLIGLNVRKTAAICDWNKDINICLVSYLGTVL